ncbi:ATP-binding cassette domain-containing protein [Paenibacillus gansuensis]|uniref:ATP-binding cassette domain-containing protein n=1 Tax=Paenibacillus gansuensis TaxID=306542 RepID=A0ABW5PB65_9BACL
MPITIRNLTVYGEDAKAEPVLKDISCSLPKESLTLIIGKSGSGKSTLLRTLGGLVPPGSGELLYDGEPLWRKNRVSRPLLLQSAVAFQFPEHQLFAPTLQREFDYSLKPYRLPKPERLRRTDAAMHSQRLPVSLLDASPFTLSGGQKRRAALAALMAAEAPWLLLDEPSAGLDAKSLTRLREELSRWKEKRSIVLVTHDIDAFLPLADRVLVLAKGELAADLAPEQLYQHPHLLVDAGVGLTPAMELAGALRQAGCALPEGIPAPAGMAAALARRLQAGAGSRHSPDPAPGPGPAVQPPASRQEQPAPPLHTGSGIGMLYQLDAKLKWLVYMLISLGVLLQSSWTGLAASMLIVPVLLLMLQPADRRKLAQLSRPFLYFMALAVFISGIGFATEASVPRLHRVEFDGSRALGTLRRLSVLFEITLLGLAFTLTTSTSAMKQGLEAALRPLKNLGAPVQMLSLAASLTLRFIPLIVEETDRFATIAKARGKRSFRKNQMPVRDLPVFAIPLLLSLFQSVEELILAMEMKGFGSRQREQLPVLQTDKRIGGRALRFGIVIFLLLAGIRCWEQWRGVSGI